MSGSYRSSRPPGNWQPGQDYWIYLPASVPDFRPARRSLNPGGRTRDPWLVVEERFLGGPHHGLASFPPPAPRPSVPLLFIDDTYPARAESPPTFYQPSTRLNPEDQKHAVSMLRRQMYNSPQLYNILRRIGTKPSDSPGGSFQDDEGKRCAVCLEDFEPRNFVMTTPCNHMFHEECIVPWVKSQGKCPVCRYVISKR